MKDWAKREKRRHKHEQREKQRISSDHELSGTRHRQGHREKDIKLSWSQSSDGTFHVTPSSVPVGGGIDISDEDWEEIFRDKSDDETP